MHGQRHIICHDLGVQLIKGGADPGFIVVVAELGPPNLRILHRLYYTHTRVRFRRSARSLLIFLG